MSENGHNGHGDLTDHDMLLELHTSICGDFGVLTQLKTLNGKVANHEIRLQTTEVWQGKHEGAESEQKNNKGDWKYTVTTVIAFIAVILALLK